MLGFEAPRDVGFAQAVLHVRVLPGQDITTSAQFRKLALDGRSGRLSGLVFVDAPPCARRARLQCRKLALHGVDLAAHTQIFWIVRGRLRRAGLGSGLRRQYLDLALQALHVRVIRRVPHSRLRQLSLQRREFGAPVAGRAAKRRTQLAQLHVELRLPLFGKPDLAFDILQVALGTLCRTLAEAQRRRQRVAVPRLEGGYLLVDLTDAALDILGLLQKENRRSLPHARPVSCGCN